MRWLSALCITFLFLTVNLQAQPIEDPGFFTIEGFSSSQLYWQGLSDPEPLLICDLGTIPNRLAIQGEYLYVVHSGSFADGSGTALWRTLLADLPGDPEPVWEILDLPEYSNPWTITFSHADPTLAFVSLLMQNTVVYIDLANWVEENSVPTYPQPAGMVELNGMLYVTASGMGQGNQVSVIDVAAAQLVDYFEVALNPQEILVGSDGLLNVLCTGETYPADNNGVIRFVDPADGGTVTELALGNNSNVMAMREDGTVAVADEWTAVTAPVQFYDSATHELLPATLSFGGFALAAGIDNHFYVGSGLSGGVRRLNINFDVVSSYPRTTQIVDIIEFNGLERVIHDTPPATTRLRIEPARPNPFNPSTLVGFTLSRAAVLTADLYDTAGRHRRHLECGLQPAGRGEIAIDGEGLGAGMYFLQLYADGVSRTVKLTRLP